MGRTPLLLASSGVLLSLACARAPEPSAVPIGVALEPLAGSPPGTVRIAASLCGCLDGNLAVRVDGAAHGAVACGGERQVVLVPGAHRLVLQGRTGAASALVDVPAQGGVRIVAGCVLVQRASR